MHNSKQKFIFKILLVVLAIVALACLRQFLQAKSDEAVAQNGVPYADMVEADHPLLLEFQRRHSDRTVVLACAEDITNDGIEDIVVISQKGDDMSTIVLYTKGSEELHETPSIPGPKENQHIRFFNMDKVGEIETLITGEKNGQVGYAIYRIMDGEMINLFGEGMEDCC